MYTQTQTLQYEHCEDDIATIAKAIDLLGHKQVNEAIEVLMDYRNRLQDMQKPKVKDYNQIRELTR